MAALGYQWLIEHFRLPNLFLQHSSKLGTSRARNEHESGRVSEQYPASYSPGDHPLDHVQFALRYDGLDLGVLQRVFRKIEPGEVLALVKKQPTGKQARLVGFLYEWLTGVELEVSCGGNYVHVLEESDYFVGPGKRYPKWRVVNNLLGSASFSPLVRKTEKITQGLRQPWKERVNQVLQAASPGAYSRAIIYLYLKETKSSYEIEHESVSGNLRERFVAILHRAGRDEVAEVLSEQNLTELQNVIVDPRYAAKGFRTGQSYVGERLSNYIERVHYVCPPPEFLASLMTGLREAAERSAALPAIVKAALVGFGFVFIHPFEDGNGRIHRFLLHDSLARGLMEPGVILPVSASMLAHPDRYDRCLEQFSRQVKAFAEYDLNPKGEMTVKNAAEIEPLYRFIDFTAQVEYFLDVLEDTVAHQLPNELDVLRGFDQARTEIRNVVDLPDRRMDVLLQYLHGNNGKLSKARRGQFAELSEDEIKEIEAAFTGAFSPRPEPDGELNTKPGPG